MVDANVTPGELTDPAFRNDWTRFVERHFVRLGLQDTRATLAQHEISVDQVPEPVRFVMEDDRPDWVTGVKFAKVPIDGRFFYVEVLEGALHGDFHANIHHPADREGTLIAEGLQF